MLSKKYKTEDQELSSVNDAIGVYVKSLTEESTKATTNKSPTLSDFFDNKILIIRAIRQGLPYKLFNSIKSITPFTDNDWAEYLNLSTKTLQRYSADIHHLFKPIHTEKIIELTEVTHFGKQVFDNIEQFYLWLQTPSFALGSIKPAELLKDSYGKELVMGELNRIEHGIFA